MDLLAGGAPIVPLKTNPAPLQIQLQLTFVPNFQLYVCGEDSASTHKFFPIFNFIVQYHGVRVCDDVCLVAIMCCYKIRVMVKELKRSRLDIIMSDSSLLYRFSSNLHLFPIFIVSHACYQGAVQSYGLQKQRVQLNSLSKAMRMRRLGSVGRQKKGAIRCNIELQDFIGGDLIKPDLGQWLSDVEEHKAIAIYSPHEGGYEGRYLTRLKYQGYHFLDLSARGLGDPETTLTKFHPVCPAHVGKQPIARWYFPPEVDYRLSLLPPDSKGLVVWIIEAKVLSKAELQFLALLPTLRPNVRVIAECGNW
ncbi:hypothetical protein KY290_037624 [Solanum tuberosum]|uniref:NAD(P)H-quinone oxidoreductase subunit N, chloroplastic n=1 Tax=Solanum tuberosum TaxID=4113 RepID=A0ABQ7TXX6_SOLTU|nr:hypothetical protein KY289_037146 [Solanum tuberosum]KAH0738919.1 hypothetical protein KY290_037624 [Solanum tuberosum]